MLPISYTRHQVPPAVIQHALWLYLRFTLSYRNVKDLLAEWGLNVSYETIRRWVGKFGPAIARNLRQLRCRPSPRWHLEEMVVCIAGRQMFCGGRSMVRARCWKSRSRADGTRPQLRRSFTSCSGRTALLRSR